MYLRKSDFERFGYTENCKGCQSIRVGGISRPHSKVCRARMEEELSKTDDGQARLRQAENRQNKVIADKMKKQDEAREHESGQAVHQSDGQEQEAGIENIDVEAANGQVEHSPDRQ